MNRILEISYKHKLAHIGSCLTMYPILENIYKNKNENDIVVLSAGHAGLAQYVIIEKYSNGKINAEDLLHIMGIHPERSMENGIYVSAGSLGSAILVAVGLAIADKSRDIYCILSDGECAEGSVWEALSFCKKTNLTNIKIYVNVNGYSAYDEVDRNDLETRLKAFCPWAVVCNTQNPEYLGGLNAHYHVMKSEEELQNIITSLQVGNI
jgi:transketolase